MALREAGKETSSPNFVLGKPERLLPRDFEDGLCPEFAKYILGRLSDPLKHPIYKAYSCRTTLGWLSQG